LVDLFYRYAKENDTQLSWCFEQVEVSRDFPLGAKTTYRAYAQDSVSEILHAKDVFLGMTPCETEVAWQPKAVAVRGTEVSPEGMFILQDLPQDSILPEPFIKNSHAQLQKTYNEVLKTYGAAAFQHYITEWELFAALCPQTDDAQEYCGQHPLYVPFKQDLFPDQCVDVHTEVPAHIRQPRKETSVVLKFSTTASVKWGNRGQPTATINPRVLTNGTDADRAISGGANQFVLSTSEFTENYINFSRIALVDLCRGRGLPVSGIKSTLQNRSVCVCKYN
jgi:hypothetical protein